MGGVGLRPKCGMRNAELRGKAIPTGDRSAASKASPCDNDFQRMAIRQESDFAGPFSIIPNSALTINPRSSYCGLSVYGSWAWSPP